MNHNTSNKKCFEISNSLKISVLVRALRSAFNLSQSALATKVGCSRPTLNRLETLNFGAARMDTVDELLHYFKKQGVEVRISDECLEIRFTKEALQSAGNSIYDSASSSKSY